MNIIINYIRKNKFILLLTVLLLQFSFVFSEKYILGGKNGWSDVNIRNSVTTGIGRYGYESLELSTKARTRNDFTDLLLNFENNEFKDQIGKYSIIENNMFISNQSCMGKGAGLSRGKSGGIILEGAQGSFFGTEGPAGSFLIDFWICPSVVENGEVLIKWRSSRSINGKIVYQLITASFYQDKIMCIFSNIFDGYTKDTGDVYLLGVKKLIPRKWSHHSICYSEEDGSLVYKVDGIIEDIKFMTSTGHENGSIYQALIGTPARLELCPEYTGLIDDFSVMRSYVDIEKNINEEEINSLNFMRYNSSGGRFESVPILVKAGSIMNSITADVNVPSETEIEFYVRSGDNYFNWTSDYPEWIPVNNGENIKGVTGLYFQVAANLYPDGAGCKTPSVSKIELDYSVLPDPQPPYKISAKKGDGSVTLSWSYSVDDTAGGYYIYYGNRPGEYLGTVAIEGASPINVGNTTVYTLNGLNNGIIYYFSVAAWSKIDNRIRGPLSKEVYARPGK